MSIKTLLAPLAIGAVAILFLGGIGITLAQGDSDPPMRSDQFEECATCHEEHAETFLLTPHSALETEGLAASAGADSSCTTCHGDPTAHLDEGGGAENIFNFSDAELPSDRSASCQSCHGTEHPRFDATSHSRAGLDCTSCHSIHGDVWTLLDAPDQIGSSLLASSVSDSCTECHNDVFAHFEFNERHRLQEGILECTSCHNPHEPSQRWMLGGFKQENCVNCHVDKGGPFVFEHGSVRGEGCTSCHTPHGSPNRHMLTFQNVAELCFSCHIDIPGFHSRFTLESQCTNCHATIHGSHFDPFFLK